MRRVLTLEKNRIATHQDTIAQNDDAPGGDIESVQHFGLNYIKSVR